MFYRLKTYLAQKIMINIENTKADLEHEISELRARNTELEQRIIALQGQIQSGKIISRAKVVLMKRYRLSEEHAHRHLQKTSMNLRIPIVQLAKRVLEGADVPPPI